MDWILDDNEGASCDGGHVLCPFCGHEHLPGEIAVDMSDARWTGRPCSHTLFVAVESMAFSGFEYRSRKFSEFLEVPHDDDPVMVPSDDDDGEPMPFSEMVERIDLPGYQWIADGDGFFIVYFGFVPSED